MTKEDLENIVNNLKSLENYEIQYIFIQLLKFKKLKLNELVEAHTHYLENLNSDKSTLICDLACSLSAYIIGGEIKKAMEVKANEALIKSRIFEGTEFAAKLNNVTELENGTL